MLSESFIVLACGSFLRAPYWAAEGEYAGPEYWFFYLEQPDSATTSVKTFRRDNEPLLPSGWLLTQVAANVWAVSTWSEAFARTQRRLVIFPCCYAPSTPSLFSILKNKCQSCVLFSSLLNSSFASLWSSLFLCTRHSSKPTLAPLLTGKRESSRDDRRSSQTSSPGWKRTKHDNSFQAETQQRVEWRSLLTLVGEIAKEKK